MVTYVKLTCQTKIHGGQERAQTGTGRAWMEMGHAQMGTYRAQTDPKSQKTLEGHISLKTCPNLVFEVFFGIYISCRCQKTPQLPNLDKF